MKKLRLVSAAPAADVLEAGGGAELHEPVQTATTNSGAIYRARLAPAETSRPKPVAYLKKNEAMGLVKVDMYPYFDAWMAPSSAWSVSPLYLHPPAEDLVRLREERDALLAALRDCSSLVDGVLGGADHDAALEKARAAIAKALAGAHR